MLHTSWHDFVHVIRLNGDLQGGGYGAKAQRPHFIRADIHRNWLRLYHPAAARSNRAQRTGRTRITVINRFSFSMCITQTVTGRSNCSPARHRFRRSDRGRQVAQFAAGFDFRFFRTRRTLVWQSGATTVFQTRTSSFPAFRSTSTNVGAPDFGGTLEHQQFATSCRCSAGVNLAAILCSHTQVGFFQNLTDVHTRRYAQQRRCSPGVPFSSQVRSIGLILQTPLVTVATR